MLIFTFTLQAQVTQINNNHSLHFNVPLSNTKQIFVSGTDQTLWVTDGTLAGTIQLSAVIKFVNDLGSITFLNGKYIFSGTTPATGSEVYITDGTPGGTVLLKDANAGAPDSNPELLATFNGKIYFTATTAANGDELWATDGTPAGTVLVKDINPGAAGSSIDQDVAVLGSFLYFTGETAAEGRELWRTNGTTAGTTLVKDIVPGTGGSNYPDKYELNSFGGTYLLFMARTPSSGVELWKSDGTDAGTVLLKDINAGADSSNARSFTVISSTNNVVLFEATDATHGDELWKTDGTPAGTTILKDINPGTDSSTKIFIEIVPGFGFSFPIFSGFHVFNGNAYFVAYDGTSAGEVWKTDGTPANTVLVKNIVQSTSQPLPFILLSDAINLSNKFIFPVSDGDTRSELWESDGTPGGTVLFKAFTPATTAIPFIFIPFSFTGTTVEQLLFQGNKFFFSAGTTAEGTELWISDGVDGTAGHTLIVKYINPGADDSDPAGTSSYLYTTTELFFAATTAADGVELWRSDGTTAGTKIVQDINPGTEDADPVLDFFLVNNKILFEATEGDNATETDLYAVDGIFTSLPIKLSEFTVTLKGNDGLLQWKTQQEINAKDFTVQRSFDGRHFENIGTVNATGTTSNVHGYSFTDAGIITCGKDIAYYRLVTSDKDGKTENSNIISLKLGGHNKWNVKLLANPVRENIRLMLSGITNNVKLSIHDMSGKTIYAKSLGSINGQINIPVSLSAGIYILNAETNNERQAIKFVK
jgi:ELWxxDGT repeat protein